MIIDCWAEKWGINFNAIIDLKKIIGVGIPCIKNYSKGHAERDINNLIRIEASKKGARLWRNNLGALHTNDGGFIRYGLANDSAQMNTIIKSADLIGIKPVLITKDLVGKTIGQFLSREIKKSNWRYSGSDKEKAQMRWAELILSLGGDAGFTTGEGTI